MVTSNKDLMTQAREALSGRWGLAMGTFFVYAFLVVGLNNLTDPITFKWSKVSSFTVNNAIDTGNNAIDTVRNTTETVRNAIGPGSNFTFSIHHYFFWLWIASGALMLGVVTFSLAIARKKEADLKMLFYGFRYFDKALGLYLFRAFFIFLWMLLLIIPGIIAALSYSLAFYIMSEDPNIDVKEAIDKSKKMMYGYKWKLFLLYCRFIGWILLGIISLGIGFLWIMPYMAISLAKFYDDVKVNFVEGQ